MNENSLRRRRNYRDIVCVWVPLLSISIQLQKHVFQPLVHLSTRFLREKKEDDKNQYIDIKKTDRLSPVILISKVLS